MEKINHSENRMISELSFFQRFSPFNKSFAIQFIFLSISIIAAFLGLYYIFYQQSIDMFIHEGILPYNLDWMLYFIGGSFIILIGLLFAPLDDLFFKRKELLDKIPFLQKEIEGKFSEEAFNEAMEIIESYFDELYTLHIYKKNDELLLLYKQAQINKKLKNMLRKAEKLLKVNAFADFREESQMITRFIEFNYKFILENQKRKFEEILRMSRINS